MKKSKKRSRRRGGLAPNKFLEQWEIQKLTDHVKQRAETAKAAGTRRAIINQMLIDVLLNAGLRSCELCQLQLRDLPHCHGKAMIHVRQGKGNVDRSVEISPALARRLREFVKHYRPFAKPRSPLFVNEHGDQLSYRSLYSKVCILGEAAGIGHLHPHKLRHTFAVEFYNKTKDLLFLQDQLGHSDPKTTAIYARTSNEQRRKMVRKFDLYGP